MKAIGNIAEENLAKILAQPLLIDFIHLNPTCIEGKKERELCDILIEDEPVVLPVQLKFQDREKAKVTRNERRWAENQLKTASRQIIGSISSIQNYDINTRHPYRGKLTFPADKLKCRHGIVIIDFNTEPFKLQADYPRRTNNNIPIHYFSYKDFISLCEKLISLPDLLRYLDERAKIPAWSTPLFNDEKNTYAYYILHAGEFGFTLDLNDFHEQWNLLTTKFRKRYLLKEHEDEKALIINEMITQLSVHKPVIVDQENQYIKTIDSLEDIDRLLITRHLNRMSTLYRRGVAKKLLDKIEKVSTSKRGYRYFAFQTDDKDTFFVFMASKYSRKERLRHLEILCDCINHLANVKRIVGVATEGMNPKDGRSYDFVYMEDFPKEGDSEYIKHCKEYFQGFHEENEDDFPNDEPNIIKPI